jgi:hypothetical protein
LQLVGKQHVISLARDFLEREGIFIYNARSRQ